MAIHVPAEPADSHLGFDPVTLPETPPHALARLRCEAEAQIERLIALLDDLDGDPDLEPSVGGEDFEHDDSDREPSLGAPENHPLVPWVGDYGEFRRDWRAPQTRWADGGGARDECEPEEDACDLELYGEVDESDDEPTLGATGAMNQIKAWARPAAHYFGACIDDGESEDAGDREPSLGWNAGGAFGGNDDREADGLGGEDARVLPRG